MCLWFMVIPRADELPAPPCDPIPISLNSDVIEFKENSPVIHLDEDRDDEQKYPDSDINE